jgi:hypothetical protein
MTNKLNLSAIALLAIFSFSSLEANYIVETFTCKVNTADIKELKKDIKDPSFSKEQKTDFKIELKSALKARKAHTCKDE